jgi:hypothetical protein
MARTVYVKTSNAGAAAPYTSWATAATSINTAIGQWESGGNNKCIIAPGKYSEAITSPPYEGASGAWNEIIGDCNNEYGNGSTGDILLDTCAAGWSTMKPCIYFTSGAEYTRIKSLRIDPFAIASPDASAGCIAVYNTRCDNFEILDCVLNAAARGSLNIPLVWFQTTTAASGTRAIKIQSCKMKSNSYCTVKISAASASAAFQATPDLYVEKCTIINQDARNGIIYIDGTSSNYNWAKLYGNDISCTFNNRAQYTIQGSNSSYCKSSVDLNWWLGFVSGDTGTTSASRTENKYVCNGCSAPTGFTQEHRMDKIGVFSLVDGSSLQGALSDDPQSGDYDYDIVGRSLDGGSNTTPGSTQGYGVYRATYKNSRGIGYSYGS